MLTGWNLAICRGSDVSDPENNITARKINPRGVMWKKRSDTSDRSGGPSDEWKERPA